jgi:hypothetical protein
MLYRATWGSTSNLGHEGEIGARGKLRPEPVLVSLGGVRRQRNSTGLATLSNISRHWAAGIL